MNDKKRIEELERRVEELERQRLIDERSIPSPFKPTATTIMQCFCPAHTGPHSPGPGCKSAYIISDGATA